MYIVQLYNVHSIDGNIMPASLSVHIRHLYKYNATFDMTIR